jgi:outer membrane receptor protein involved in Fe transport
MDGVRLNRAFGDIVSWDLIPKNAISSMQLYSGNPLFGLNTLGGALSIQTKDGRSNPGGLVQLTTGSWGRNIGEFEYGGVSKDSSVDYFIAGTWFNEDGWRDHSRSDNQQLFTKLGWQGEKTDLHLTYSYVNNDLNGNGTAPRGMLARNYSGVYTFPDNTQNESHFLNLNWSHYFTDNVQLSGNTYYRNIKTNAKNGDIGSNIGVDSTDAQKLGQSILLNTSTILSDAALISRCGNNVTSGKEPGEKCTGVLNRSNVAEDNYGIFGQVSVQNKLFDLNNSYVVGAGYDRSTSRYSRSLEYGSILQSGGFYGSGVYATPDVGLLSNGTLIDERVGLKGTTSTWSLFGTDTVDIADNLHLTGALRYNHTKLVNKDQLAHYDGTDPSSYPNSPNDNTLSGNHIYSRLNPSVGLAFSPTQTVNVYGSYSEGSRAPTSIELGCSDPENPCRLPNAMANDPELKQVVSKTWEAGIRTKLTPELNLSASVYDTRSINDIIFVGTNTSGDGYFSNVGQIERKGFDTSFGYQLGQLTLSGNYTYLDATYESDFSMVSGANSAGTLNCNADSTHSCTAVSSPGLQAYNSDQTYYSNLGIYSALSTATGHTTDYAPVVNNGVADSYMSNVLANSKTGTAGMFYNNNNDYSKTIDVKKGNRVPLTPHHVLKLFADYKLNEKITLGANTFTASDSILRGNENGLDSRGSVAGYTLLNLTATYKVQPEWILFAKVNNVFDKDYYSGGTVGMNPLNEDGTRRINRSYVNYSQSVSEAFVAPGAPRAAWVGVRYEFGGKKSSQVDKD